MQRTLRFAALLPALVGCLAFAAVARGDGDVGYQLVPDTAVLLTQAASGGGNGGNTSSTTSNTNIFSPGTYVDYKRSGGEPTTAVDRYPFVPGPYAFGATSKTYRDLIYVSNPLGIAYPG
ncbi:MAG: hypothetical protein QOG81_1816, partial [Gaiellaceae bacterium]|nr:hypothetical protein [Gaiellaceae bacterium]